jgi:uncharacterized membrane protein YhhN
VPAIETKTLSRASIAFPVVCIVGCAALVASHWMESREAAVLAKLIASSSFVAFAISLGATRTIFGRLVLAGLSLSWLGDMLLLGTTHGAFLSGLVAFLIAHVMYISAFTVHCIDWRRALAAAVPVGAISVFVSLWLSPYVAAPMQLPVQAYTLVISVMLATALGTGGAGLAIPLGAALFYFSDLSVAAGQFVKPDFPNYVWGLPFYYSGQLLLAWSTRSIAQSPPGVSDNR